MATAYDLMTPAMVGVEISCKIGSCKIPSAKMQYVPNINAYYICQDSVFNFKIQLKW